MAIVQPAAGEASEINFNYSTSVPVSLACALCSIEGRAN